MTMKNKTRVPNIHEKNLSARGHHVHTQTGAAYLNVLHTSYTPEIRDIAVHRGWNKIFVCVCFLCIYVWFISSKPYCKSPGRLQNHVRPFVTEYCSKKVRAIIFFSLITEKNSSSVHDVIGLYTTYIECLYNVYIYILW